jgi:hypothetical protein
MDEKEKVLFSYKHYIQMRSKKYRSWKKNNADIDLIESLYPTHTVDQIAEKLGATKWSVIKAIGRFGITKR